MIRPEIDIKAALQSLQGQQPPSAGFVAEELRSRPWARLGRSSDSYALLFCAVGNALEPDLIFENLKVRFNVECVLKIGQRRDSQRLCIIECCSTDAEVVDTFLSVAGLFLPDSPDFGANELRQTVLSIAELFSAMGESAKGSVIGLWGELFVIAQSSDPGVVASSWHRNPTDRFDFASSGLRVEVKTTTGVRRHIFSLDQLTPPAGAKVVIASIVTIHTSDGVSLGELLAVVAKSTSDVDLRGQVISTAMKTLGNGWRQGSESRFDHLLARDTLRWVDSIDVPRVSGIPAEVSEVRFKADLTSAEALERPDLIAMGPLGNALVPPSQL